ncbi:MAG: DUF4982 domain-containing protein [Bacteroidales bacterium]|nr:DUF4982 domain-containing protein [Bacteroidales bacterium]
MRTLLTAIALAMATLATHAADSRAVAINDGWTFSLNGAEARSVTLPHDWSIEGDFAYSNPAGTGGGALPGGVGEYTLSLPYSPEWKGKEVWVDFDGVYMLSTVSINGHELGTRPNGYVSFTYNLTPWLVKGDNLLTVRVDNSRQPNSRWYSGSGIYRNVWLRVVNPTHIVKDGLVARPVSVDTDSALVEVAVTLSQPLKGQLRLSLDSDSGEPIWASQVAVNGSEAVTRVNVPHPSLWSCENPHLYTLRATLMQKGKEIDSYTTRIGLRDAQWDSSEGFSLNGKKMKINGVCLHHDFGALGAAFHVDAARRQLQMMKDMGANAIRCTHNPPAPELLDLCDEIGLMVIDEAFDMWRRRKSTYDYSLYFDQWHERDLRDLIRRDRNHPCVIAWSVGNEVLEQWDAANADDLSLEEANLILNFGHERNQGSADNESTRLTRRLVAIAHDEDPTRPVTAGCNEPDPSNNLFASGALDLIGFNYHDDWFAGVPQNFPGKPFYVSESVSALMTRGHYTLPADSVTLCPERWDKPYYDPSLACSSFDNCHVPWGNTHEGTLRLVAEYPHIAGQFVWTGFDYLGEPTPYGWPARSSYFGLVDLAGIPKDAYYMYQSQWLPEQPMVHLLPHWNWQEGEKVDIRAYAAGVDSVALTLNGKPLLLKPTEHFYRCWQAPFEPGEILAIGYKNGKEVARDSRHTATLPHHIVLHPDRAAITTADGLCFVEASVVDHDGNPCPQACDRLTFSVDGSAFNAGTDNGDPTCLDSFKSDHRRAFHGKAMLIAQGDGHDGPVTVTASAPGLIPATITLNHNPL